MRSDNTQNFRSVANVYIDRSKLKRSQYVMSLLQEGRRTGLITGQEMYRIQVGIMQVLKKLIRRYTQGESTSVTTETAEGIMVSLIYALDAYSLHFENPEEAIVHLKSKDVKDMHAEGVERLRRHFEDVKQLYRDVKKMKLDVPVDAYNMTINESLPVFMNNYDLIFEAQNTMASIDYPLAVDDMRLQGVFYIKQYLKRLKMETEFCRLFSRQDLMFILTNFGKIHGLDYRIELFNIFALMVNNAFFSLLSGGDPRNVRISENQYDWLNRMLTACHADQRAAVIHEGMDRLQEVLGTDQALTCYMNLYRDELLQRVNHTAANGGLEMLIIREAEEREKPMTLMLHENERMSDVQMRKLIEKIMESDDAERKVRLIRDHVASLSDYLDLLDAGCLFGNEYEALFADFEDIELAIFAKIVLYEELKGNDCDFPEVIAEATETDREWEMHYIRFMQQLDVARIESVGRLVNDIDYEEISFF